MNNISKYLVTILVMFSVSSALIAEDYKIGVVNQLQLMENAPQTQTMKALLQKEFEPMDRELVVMQKKLKEDQDKLQKDQAIMSESQSSKLQRDIITQQRELKRKQDEFTEDLTFRRNEELAKVQQEIIVAIQAVAQENNFDIVLYDGVIHASPKVNITQKVIDYLNAKK